MPPEPADTPPELDEQVLVRYGDLAALQESLQCAKEDLKVILAALRAEVTSPMTAHQIVTEVIVPRIAQLVATHGMVIEAEQQLRDRASLLAVPEVDLGGGRKAQLAGRRIPDAQLQALGLSAPKLRQGRRRR